MNNGDSTRFNKNLVASAALAFGFSLLGISLIGLLTMWSNLTLVTERQQQVLKRLDVSDQREVSRDLQLSAQQKWAWEHQVAFDTLKQRMDILERVHLRDIRQPYRELE